MTSHVSRCLPHAWAASQAPMTASVTSLPHHRAPGPATYLGPCSRGKASPVSSTWVCRQFAYRPHFLLSGAKPLQTVWVARDPEQSAPAMRWRPVLFSFNQELCENPVMMGTRAEDLIGWALLPNPPGIRVPGEELRTLKLSSSRNLSH